MLENFSAYLSRLGTLAYTLWVCPRLRKCGKGSRIMRPATLNNGTLIEIGEGVIIREHAWLNADGQREDGRAHLKIGDGTYIGRFVHINAFQDVVIESKALLADRVYISDVDHRFGNSHLPIIDQGYELKGPILLRTGCWIGIGAVILGGVTIGRNAVVAAGAVVTKSVSDYAVVAGIPARVIKQIEGPSAL